MNTPLGSVGGPAPSSSSRLLPRFVVFGAIVVIVVAALGLRLFQLQIAMGGHFTDLAQQQSVGSLSIPVGRGLIYDRKGRQLVENVPVFVVKVRPADLPFDAREAVVARLAHLLKMPLVDLYAAIDAHADSRYDLVKVASGVPTQVAQVIAEEHLQLPGVYVDVEARRHYLYGELLGHILGWTGNISGPDYLRLKDDGYVLDDTIGKAGVEATFEKQLRGTYGVQQVQRDATGRVVRTLSTLTAAGARRLAAADHRRQRAAHRAAGAAMGHERGRAAARRVHRDEPADRRDPGHGLAAQLQQQRLLGRHLVTGVQAPAQRQGAAAAQLRHQRAVPARLHLQAGDRRRARSQDNKLQPGERIHTAAYITIGRVQVLGLEQGRLR